MALGLLYDRDNKKQSYEAIYDKVQQFIGAFKKVYGSINCYDLTGLDISKEEERKIFVEKGIKEKCGLLTGKAAGLVAELISND